MLVRPPTDVSPTENSWMLHSLDKLSPVYFASDRTIPSLNSDLIELSDTRLPTATRFSAAKAVEFNVWAEHASDGGAPIQ
jgi:hypothetical protein